MTSIARREKGKYVYFELRDEKGKFVKHIGNEEALKEFMKGQEAVEKNASAFGVKITHLKKHYGKYELCHFEYTFTHMLNYSSD